ncbi:hypothetical protein Tco_1438884 [Tanacetum coccineum]
MLIHLVRTKRERELLDRLKDMEKERDDWRQTASEQVDRIKKLEEEFVSDAVRRLHTSVEYQKNLAVHIGLCFTAG